ncbi:MAG: DUF4268 domain-containing protein [Sphingobacterium sp.]
MFNKNGSFVRKTFTLYSREEAKKIKEAFWTTFGNYMRPIPGAEGTRVNWINYKTGIRHLFFRMDADQHSAQIRIQIAHPDEGMRALLFDQFREYRSLLHTLLGEEWHWRLDHRDGYGKSHAYIGLECYDWNVFERADWSDLISFFKPRIILLDQFWSDAQDGFDAFK